MGRGRQKAKQTKVARELKYHSSSIDVHALQRELAGDSGPPDVSVSPPVDDVDDDDPYAAYADDEAEDDEEPAGGYAAAPSRRR